MQMTLDAPYAPFLAALPLVSIVEQKLVEQHSVKDKDGKDDWARPGCRRTTPDRAPSRSCRARSRR
ncbi:MAG: hypothetical protein WDO24_28330 [Pseudomonadota bacterium]